MYHLPPFYRVKYAQNRPSSFFSLFSPVIRNEMHLPRLFICLRWQTNQIKMRFIFVHSCKLDLVGTWQIRHTFNVLAFVNLFVYLHFRDSNSTFQLFHAHSVIIKCIVSPCLDDYSCFSIQLKCMSTSHLFLLFIYIRPLFYVLQQWQGTGQKISLHSVRLVETYTLSNIIYQHLQADAGRNECYGISSIFFIHNIHILVCAA